MASPGDSPNRWLTPGVLFGVLGMIASIGAAWVTFESRIARGEEAIASLSKRFERVEDKLDRLIERGR